MSSSCTYRRWALYCRRGEAGWECVVVSPYGVVTTAVGAPEKAKALEAAKNAVDCIIDEHYPGGEMGRYPPPTTYTPRPGQRRGLPFVAGRQRVSEPQARAYCEAVEPAS